MFNNILFQIVTLFFVAGLAVGYTFGKLNSFNNKVYQTVGGHK